MSFKAGFVGLVGLPNAGKSTLLNRLVKEKISIVTEKPQTTRRRILGIVSDENRQIVYVDSPGFIDAKKGLNQFLNLESLDVIKQSDVLLLLLSIDTQEEAQIDQMIKLCKESNKSIVAVLNKCDVVEFSRRIAILKKKLEDIKTCKAVLEYSDQWGKDRADVLEQINNTVTEYLPESPKPLFDVELFTPHTTRDLVAEIVREKCFLVLEKELPYQIAVQVLSYKEEELIKIQAVILVAKDSHKAIVIGKAAAVIKKIGMLARKDIEKLVGAKVFLQLDVKTKENWMENPRLMKELGYKHEHKS